MTASVAAMVERVKKVIQRGARRAIRFVKYCLALLSRLRNLYSRNPEMKKKIPTRLAPMLRSSNWKVRSSLLPL